MINETLPLRERTCDCLALLSALRDLLAGIELEREDTRSHGLAICNARLLVKQVLDKDIPLREAHDSRRVSEQTETDEDNALTALNSYLEAGLVDDALDEFSTSIKKVASAEFHAFEAGVIKAYKEELASRRERLHRMATAHLDLLKELQEWNISMGYWEAPCWEKVRLVLRGD